MTHYTSLDEVSAAITACNCALCLTRTKPVPGEGNPHARVMFVGEAPGFHEDKEGRSLIGVAGQFLDEMLASIYLKRSDIYLTNMVHSRPPGNRDPLPEELDASWPYLAAQIKLIDPKVIVTLGQFSKAKFVPDAGAISLVHGQAFIRPNPATGAGEQWYVTLYHPAEGLHDASRKIVIEQDFQVVRQALLAATAKTVFKTEHTKTQHIS